jgi:hypothetical protein
VLHDILLDISTLAARGNKEIANPQLLDWCGLDGRPDVQLKSKASSEDTKVKKIVGMWLDSCELVKFMQVYEKAVSNHLMDGLVIAERTVVASYYAGVRP